MTRSPRDQYLHQLSRPGFVRDPAQAEVVEALHQVYELLGSKPTGRGNWWRKLVARRPAAVAAASQGLYIWGSVGCGKSLLMDMFFASVPGARKQRIHFHQFMQQIHLRLKALGGVVNPLTIVASEIATQYDLICFDEMQVHDVADAMLLGGLLTALFERNVVLVATSNRPPDELYLHGLQRERFLQTIRLIKRQMVVHHLSSVTDYRYRTLVQLKRYLTPLSAQTDQAMAQAFELSALATVRPSLVNVNGRDIAVLAMSGDVVWFDFQVLCGGPRSTSDYLLIAEQFHTVFLSHVPQLFADDYDLAHRFMNLVDVLYDQKVNLVVSAATEPQSLYAGERFQFEFTRVVSRLVEMQSEEYLRASKRELPDE